MSLRKDERQWLIYDEESVRSVVRGIEAFLMGLGAQALLKNPEIAIRALANVGVNVSDTRLKMMRGGYLEYHPSDEERQVAQHLDEIVTWWAGEGERPEEALDALHAALVWFDKRINAAGVIGPGWYREVVRGE